MATVAEGAPRVRMVHPTWEGETLWFATGASPPKVRQMQANPIVDTQHQLGPPTFTHVRVRGRAPIVRELAEKKRVWRAAGAYGVRPRAWTRCSSSVSIRRMSARQAERKRSSNFSCSGAVRPQGRVAEGLRSLVRGSAARKVEWIAYNGVRSLPPR